VWENRRKKPDEKTGVVLQFDYISVVAEMVFCLIVGLWDWANGAEFRSIVQSADAPSPTDFPVSGQAARTAIAGAYPSR